MKIHIQIWTLSCLLFCPSCLALIAHTIGADFRSTPTCSAPTLKNIGTDKAPKIQVNVVCNIAGVSPEPRCEFFQTKSGQRKQLVPSSNVHEGPLKSGNDDPLSLTFSRQCSMTRPVTDLTPGRYTFQVSMYPTESKVPNGRNFGTNATSSDLILSIGSPTCKQPRLTDSNDDVTFTCNLKSVYSNFLCDFYNLRIIDKKTPLGKQMERTVSTVLSCTSTPPVSCVNQCKMTTPVSSLGPGNQKFRLVVRSIDAAGGETGNAFISIYPLQLSYPTAKLRECPTKVVKQGDQVTCVCVRDSPGNPPGRVQWVTSSNTEVGTWNEQLKRSTLSLTYDSKSANTVYYCQGVSSLGQGVKARYGFKPNYGYLPQGIVEFSTPTVFDLCSSASLPMTCSISKAGVATKPNVVIKGLYQDDNDKSLEPYQNGIRSEKYMFGFSFFPISGGNISARCVATDAKSGDFITEASETILIREPPPSAPIVVVNNQPVIRNGQTVDVVLGRNESLRCNIPGGIPNVTKVILSCKNIRYESPGTQLTMFPNKFLKEETCNCTGVHPSGCYDKHTKVHINIQYPGRMTRYSLATNTETVVFDKSSKTDYKMEVDTGTTVNVTCEGEGNPRPPMVVKSQLSSIAIPCHVITSGDYVNRAVATKVMTCRDTGSYKCDPSNGISSSNASHAAILVLVKCSPELLYPKDEKQTFTHSQDAHLVIKTQIVGHPPPTNFTLTRLDDVITKRSNGSRPTSKPIDPKRYNAFYLPINERQGTVLLTLYNLKTRDDGQYQLDIQNGIADGFQYVFYIEEITSSQVAVIVGGVVAGLAVLGAVTIIVLLLYRKSAVIHNVTSHSHVKIDATANPSPADSNYEDINAPIGHYEEVDTITTENDYLTPLEMHQMEGNTENYEDVAMMKDENDTDKTAYENEDHDPTVYENEDHDPTVYEDVDGHVGSSDQRESVYVN